MDHPRTSPLARPKNDPVLHTTSPPSATSVNIQSECPTGIHRPLHPHIRTHGGPNDSATSLATKCLTWTRRDGGGMRDWGEVSAVCLSSTRTQCRRIRWYISTPHAHIRGVVNTMSDVLATTMLSSRGKWYDSGTHGSMTHNVIHNVMHGGTMSCIGRHNVMHVEVQCHA